MKSFINEYRELRELISKNPTLPLMFMANDNCGNPDYTWTIATAKAEKGIYLEAPEINEEKMYSDEDDLREDIEEIIADEHPELTELQLEEAVKERMEQYRNKWIDVIYIYVEAY